MSGPSHITRHKGTFSGRWLPGIRYLKRRIPRHWSSLGKPDEVASPGDIKRLPDPGPAGVHDFHCQHGADCRCLEGERCWDCDRSYGDVIWTAPDDLWNELTGWGKGGLLCPDCFGARAQARGIFVRFVPHVEHPISAKGTETMSDVLVHIVEPGWTDQVFIPNPGRESYRVLFYADGSARFEHRCNRGRRGTIICAPLLQLDGGHRIVQRDPLTIDPSILCPDCGTHGLIQDSRWVPS